MVVGPGTGALVKVSALVSAMRESFAQPSMIDSRPTLACAASLEQSVVRPGATVSRAVSRLGPAVSDCGAPERPAWLRKLPPPGPPSAPTSDPSYTLFAVPLRLADRYIRRYLEASSAGAEGPNPAWVIQPPPCWRS